MRGAQRVYGAFALVLAAFLLIGGSLEDRYGRRRVFVLGAAVFAAASVWCALSPGPGQLVAARAVQGAGGALLVPASLAIVGGRHYLLLELANFFKQLQLAPPVGRIVYHLG